MATHHTVPSVVVGAKPILPLVWQDEGKATAAFAVDWASRPDTQQTGVTSRTASLQVKQDLQQ